MGDAAAWVSTWPTFLSVIAVLFVPGLALVATTRVRGLALWAVAPAVSIGLLSGAAIVFPLIGIRWSVLSVTTMVLCVIALSLVLRGVLARRAEPYARVRRRPDLLLLIAIIAGMLFSAFRVAFYVGNPAAISQTNDAVFHLNAVRYVLESGSASSLTLSSMIDAGSVYPAAWHMLVATVVQISGAEIAVAANTVSIAIATVVWVPGISWLTARIVHTQHAVVRRVAPIAAAVLAAAMMSFPMLLLQWGVLYPNALSVAMLPAAIAASLSIVARWSAREPRPPRPELVAALVIAALALGGVALAQPSSVLIWTIFVALAISGQVLLSRQASAKTRTIVVVVLWACVLVIWTVLTNFSGGSHWGTFRSPARAGLDVIVNSQVALTPQPLMSALMLVGVFVAVRRPTLRWFAAVWLVLSGLYVTVATIDQIIVRDSVLGAWYADPYRLAALTPLAVIPLAAIATAVGVHVASQRIHAVSERILTSAVVALAVLAQVVALIFFPVLNLPLPFSDRLSTQSAYTITERSYLSLDERRLLERVSAVVGDARVIGNPSTGMAFGYALTGADIFPRTWSPPRTDEWQVLAEDLRYAADEPSVCEALEYYESPEYVLDFGPGSTSAGRYVMEGLTEFSEQPGFVLIDQVGEASLWRIDACSSS